MSTPRWLERGRQDLGLAEIAGPAANDRIIGYWRAIGRTDVSDDETAWCAVWSSAILEASGVPSPRSAAARAFLDWGVRLAGAVPGCLVVTSRQDPRNSQAAHVGFFVGWQGADLLLLAGNQGDRVSIAAIAAHRVIAFVWPPGEPMPPGAKAVGVHTINVHTINAVPAPPGSPAAGGGQAPQPPTLPPAATAAPGSRLEDFRASKTVLGALMAAVGLVVQWGADAVDWLLQAAAAIAELAPLKAALQAAGANAKAAGFALGVLGLVLVVHRRLFADSKVPTPTEKA